MYWREFNLNRDLLPRSLYRGRPYKVGGLGVIMSGEIMRGLEFFLGEFLSFCGFRKDGFCEPGIYLRTDAFISEAMDRLIVLEVNARFVDGWGTALNLCRACGFPVGGELIGEKLPQAWHLPSSNNAYYDEFLLTLQELRNLGKKVESFLPGEPRDDRDPMYYYGWDRPEELPNIVPAYGYEIENKMRLAQFSRSTEWDIKGGRTRCVNTPLCWYAPEVPWEHVANWMKSDFSGTVLKFAEKYSADHLRAGKSVLYQRDVRGGRFARQCYNRNSLIAQQMIHPATLDKKACQVVILSCGATPVTGYVLWEREDAEVINDSALHGPLMPSW